MFLFVRSFFLLLLTTVFVAALPLEANANRTSPWFVLAGDSTTAKQSSGGGGWGTGFLKTLQLPAGGTNLGHNGATTVSFRQMGDWATVISEVKLQKSAHTVYVTIQFGHNDQKTDKGITLVAYQKNLQTLADEVKAAGGIPILVTPLTRRSFAAGKVNENLHKESTTTLAAAAALSIPSIDLNKDSTRYVNAIGEAAAHTYDLKSGDSTHLNEKGSVVFGRIVADLIEVAVPAVKPWIRKDAVMSAAIRAGKVV